MAAFSSVRLPHNISICNTNDRATESQTASAEKKPHTLGSIEHIKSDFKYHTYNLWGEDIRLIIWIYDYLIILILVHDAHLKMTTAEVVLNVMCPYLYYLMILKF